MKAKKYVALLLALVFALASIPFSASAEPWLSDDWQPIEIAPTIAFTASMTSSIDSMPDVPTEEVFDVTLIFRSMMPASQQIMLAATNGAEILIADPSDVNAMMGVNVGSINSITNDNGVIRFRTSIPAAAAFDNTLTFQVRAPIDAGDFTLTARIGLENSPIQPNANFVERTFTAAPAFFINVSHDVILGSEPFTIYGQIGAENYNGLHLVGFSINCLINDEAILSDLVSPNPDGSFAFNDLVFPSGADEGFYRIRATWLDMSTFAEVHIYIMVEFRHPPFEIWPSQDIVIDDELFDIFGSIGFAGQDIIVGFTVIHIATGFEAIERFFPANSDGTFSYYGISFPDNAPEGLYRIEARWLNTNTFEFGEVEGFIELRRSLPPSITLSVNPTPIIMGEAFTISGEAYPFDNHYVFIRVRNPVTGEEIWETYWLSNGSFSFAHTFQPPQNDVTLEITVELFHDVGVDYLATAQAAVELRNPPPQVNNVPDRIRLDANLTGVTFITSYPAPFRNIFRAGQNTPITISGVATLNGQPVENAQIRVGLWYWAWTIPQNHHRHAIVTTDANGRFSYVIRVPNGLALSQRQYIHWVQSASSIHILEEALIYAEAVYNLSVFDERDIFVLAGIR